MALIGAMARNGIIFSRLVASKGQDKRGVDADDFRLFLLDLREHLPDGALILLDNAPIHTAESVMQTLERLKKTKNIAVLFLPPYSPFLNPIEYAFSKIKGIVWKANLCSHEDL